MSLRLALWLFFVFFVAKLYTTQLFAREESNLLAQGTLPISRWSRPSQVSTPASDQSVLICMQTAEWCEVAPASICRHLTNTILAKGLHMKRIMEQTKRARAMPYALDNSSTHDLAPNETDGSSPSTMGPVRTEAVTVESVWYQSHGIADTKLAGRKKQCLLKNAIQPKVSQYFYNTFFGHGDVFCALPRPFLRREDNCPVRRRQSFFWRGQIQLGSRQRPRYWCGDLASVTTKCRQLKSDWHQSLLTTSKKRQARIHLKGEIWILVKKICHFHKV